MKNKRNTAKKHIGKILDSKNGFDVIECSVCGFKHVMPLQRPEKLKVFYEKNFYTSERPDYFKDMKEDCDWWMATYKNWYSIFSQNVKGKRLLDIGSGPGYFLKCGQDLGWDVVGVEPSPHACEYANKLGVKTIQCFFTANLFEHEKKFDVITMSLVLEHVSDPAYLITEAKTLLKPGGLLMVMSPNDYNPFQNVLRTELKFQPWWIVPKHHLNYFDFHSIQRLLKKKGLSVVESLATFPIDIFLLFGDNYINNRKLGRTSHKKRKNFEQAMYNYSPEKLDDLYRLFAKQGIGREFVIFAKKR